MAEQQRQSLCPRLIDYLTIVGARSHTVGRTGVGQNPSIQVSFPQHISHCFLVLTLLPPKHLSQKFQL